MAAGQPTGLAGPLELQSVIGLQGTLGVVHEPDATSQSLTALAAAAPGVETATAAAAAAAIGKREPADLDGCDAPDAKRMKLAAQMPAGSPQPDQEGAETEAAAAAVAEPGIPGHEAGEAAASTGQLLQQAPVPTLDPAAAAAMGLTPEQQEQMQQLMLQQMPLATLSHEALAAMPALPLVGASGEMPQVALDPAALAAMNVPILGPDGNQLTPEQVALVFGGNPTGFPWLLPPGAVLAGMPVASPASVESGYKNWWEEHEEKELVQLAEDPSYRLDKLGSEELDWAAVAAYFGPARSQNAVRKKYWQLTRRGASGDSDSENLELTAVDAGKQRARADRRMWTDEEALELMKLVGDPLYRSHVLHPGDNATDSEMWELLAMHFNCSVQTVKRKHRHAQEALNNGTLGVDKGKRQHHRKKTPYRWMIVHALGELPNLQGTAPEIFERIEANARFVLDLDQRIMPGTKHVPRWKIQVRKVLSGDKVFEHTGMKQKHETVWRLNQHELQEAQASSRNAGRNTAAAQAAAEVMQQLPHLRFGASAAPSPRDASVSVADNQQLDHSVAAAGPLPAPQMSAEEMALVHQQIAAAIAHAPLVVPPEQLPQMSDMQLAAAAGVSDMASIQPMAAPLQHGQLEEQVHRQQPQEQQHSSEPPDSGAAAAGAMAALLQHGRAEQVAEQQQQGHQTAQESQGIPPPAGLHHLHSMQAAMQAAVQQQQQQQQQQHAGSEGNDPGDGIHAAHAAHAEHLAHLALPLSPLDAAALAALTAGHSPALPVASLPLDMEAAAGLTLPVVHASAALSDEKHTR